MRGIHRHPGVRINWNVVFHFASVFESETLPELSLDYTEPNELQDVQWIPVNDALKMEMAFNHATKIAEFLSRDK